jgi:hypothetical protein
MVVIGKANQINPLVKSPLAQQVNQSLPFGFSQRAQYVHHFIGFSPYTPRKQFAMSPCIYKNKFLSLTNLSNSAKMKNSVNILLSVVSVVVVNRTVR